MKQNNIYLVVLSLVFASFVVVFNTFPRSKYSELEKRELAVFPEFSLDKLSVGAYTTSINAWFSDSEPFRDELMGLSMLVKDYMRLTTDEEQVTFHASKTPTTDNNTQDEIDDPIENPLANAKAKIANRGIIIVGSGDNVRALMAYGAGTKGGIEYASAANTYKETFGADVNVYCMVIPTAAEYYCPDKARDCTSPQRPTIDNVHTHLAPDVYAVDAHAALGKHVNEDIYLRTDHHWAPLGAFYAAQEFAKVAKVPFRPLSSYERKVVHGYVGSMYGYSNDIAIKNAPEDFVYYEPKGIAYTTEYTDYKINKNYEVIGIGKTYNDVFFYKHKDGSSGAYCTFMGVDTRITKVSTDTKNKRRVLILKDSFGNAIPGYLFYSFEEIYVVDCRYFTKNMKQFVREHQITDILFANNIFNANASHTGKKYKAFLSQSNGTLGAKSASSNHKEKEANTTNSSTDTKTKPDAQ